MKARARTLLVAVSCVLAGFITRDLLTRQPQPNPTSVATVASPTLAPVAMLTFPTVLTQESQIYGGTWYHWPDGTMQRTAPPEMRRGYYDLIDTRIESGADLRDLK